MVTPLYRIVRTASLAASVGDRIENRVGPPAYSDAALTPARAVPTIRRFFASIGRF